MKDARASSRRDERPAWCGGCRGPAREVHFPLRDTGCTEQVLADGNSDEVSVSGDSPPPEWKNDLDGSETGGRHVRAPLEWTAVNSRRTDTNSRACA